MYLEIYQCVKRVFIGRVISWINISIWSPSPENNINGSTEEKYDCGPFVLDWFMSNQTLQKVVDVLKLHSIVYVWTRWVSYDMFPSLVLCYV